MIEIDDESVRRALSDLQRRVADMTPAMHAIGQALVEGSRERILAGRDWTGAPFAPNSPVTLARKKGDKPLIDTGTFMDDRLGYQASRDQVVIFSSAKQAGVLQFGAKKGAFGEGRYKTRRGTFKMPWGDIPPRRFFPVTQDGQLDEAARRTVLDVLRAHLDDLQTG